MSMHAFKREFSVGLLDTCVTANLHFRTSFGIEYADGSSVARKRVEP